MERETIDLSNLEDVYRACFEEGICDNESDIIIYEFVDSQIIDVELDKGYKTMEIVVQRVSDKKYFKFEYDYSYHWQPDEVIAEEVFPKEVTITIYE